MIMKKLDLDKQKPSPRNCLPITKQAPERRKSSLIKTTQTTTTPIQPTLISTTPSIINSKDPKLSALNRHKMLKANPKLRNSISSKEDFRTKNTKGPPIQISLPSKRQSKKNQIHLNSNPNLNPAINPLATGTSNCVLTTNYSDKEEEKKPKSFNNKQEMSLNSLQHLGNLFRSSNFKQTIIIDDEGNNNLNLNLKHLSNRKSLGKNVFEHNPLHMETNTPKSAMPIKITYPTLNDNIPEQDQSQSQSQSNEISQLDKAHTNPNDEGNDSNRLSEYKMIFNLLNNNIAQMKTIIEKNCEFSQGQPQPGNEPQRNIKQRFNSHKEPQEISNRIISKKDMEEINKVQCEPCDLSSNNTIAIIDNGLNVKDNNSFLDSCLHEDFYQSFAKKNDRNINDHKLNLTFEYSTILPKNDNTCLNILNANNQTECDNNDQAYEKISRMHTHHISPHFLLNKAGSYKTRRNDKKTVDSPNEDNKKNVPSSKENNSNKKETPKDKDPNKCLIF